jgi:hypothetical protein
MKSFNITVLLIFSIALFAKGQLYQDISGRVVILKDYKNVEGFPYLYDNWRDGYAISENGKTFTKLALKYDLVEDNVYFKSDGGEELLFIEPIKSFTIIKDGFSEKFSNGFPSIDNNTSVSYYQIIFKGNGISLLLRNSKYISEIKIYTSASTEKKFNQYNSYYLLKNGMMEKFKPSKNDILKLFSDKSKQVTDFIKSANIDFKNNLDLAKIFDFYYSLK